MRKLIIFLVIILMFCFSINKYNPIKEESIVKEIKTSTSKPCIRIRCYCKKAPCICPCKHKSNPLIKIIKPTKETKEN